MARESAFHPVGQIVSTFGLKGHLKVNPMTDFLDRFAPGARLRLRGNWAVVEDASTHKGQIVLKISGIDDIDAAEALRGEYLEIAATDKPTLERDEYMTADLIGLTAVTPSGEVLGKVEDVLRAPAHDLLVVGEMVVPTVKNFVKKVDLKGGKIVLQLIPGMRPGEEP